MEAVEEKGSKPASKRRADESKRRRKRQRMSPPKSSDTKKKKKQTKHPLNGMIVAVSTLDIKGQSHEDSQSSYKAVSNQCQELGATITGQLHRRVSCLVCNEAAVRNATQRVRKAIKKKVPLVDVAWVRECREKGELVDMESFRLDDQAAKVIESRKVTASEKAVTTTDDDVNTELSGVPDSAWTQPTSLGCCCVCHENGDKDCPWCEDCSPKR